MIKIQAKTNSTGHLFDVQKRWRRGQYLITAGDGLPGDRILSQREWDWTLKKDAWAFKLECFVDKCKSKLRKIFGKQTEKSLNENF